MMTATFTAHCPAIECAGCANSIQRSLSRIAGVENVAVDIAAKQVRVEYDATQTGPEPMRERLTLAGFPPEPENAG